MFLKLRLRKLFKSQTSIKKIKYSNILKGNLVKFYQIIKCFIKYFIAQYKLFLEIFFFSLPNRFKFN